MRFEIDQRLKVAIDGGQSVAVEPGDERELAPGRHQLVFEWPSGAHADLALEAAPWGELRVDRAEGLTSAGRLPIRRWSSRMRRISSIASGLPCAECVDETIFSDSTPPMCALS